MDFQKLLKNITIRTDGFGKHKRLTMVLTDENEIDAFLDWLNPTITLDDLDISVRTRNCLAYYFSRVKNIYPDKVTPLMVKELFDTEQILKVKNLGKKSRQELIKGLANVGIDVNWKN